MASFDDLSDEATAVICSFLKAIDRCSLACVARRFTERTLTKPGANGAKWSPLEDGARRRSLRVLPRTPAEWAYWWRSSYRCNAVGPGAMSCSRQICLCRAREDWVQLWQKNRE